MNGISLRTERLYELGWFSYSRVTTVPNIRLSSPHIYTTSNNLFCFMLALSLSLSLSYYIFQYVYA
jgi:hypothetical protein